MSFEAIVVPYPDVEEYESHEHFFNEFINDDYKKLDICGIPVWFSHDDEREHREAGIVTDYYFDDNDNLCCRVHLKFNPEGICAAGLIDDMGYKEVSLQHGTDLYEDNTYNKYPIELSICKKGRRNSPITQWMNHSQLEAALDDGTLPWDDKHHPFFATQRAYKQVGKEMPESDFVFPINVGHQPQLFDSQRSMASDSSHDHEYNNTTTILEENDVLPLLKFDRFRFRDKQTMLVRR